MVTKRFSTSLMALAGIGLMVGGSVGAQTITQTFTMPGQTGNFNFPNPTAPWLHLLKFDSSLGILTSVTLTFNTSIVVSGQVKNNDTINHTVNSSTANTQESIQGPDGVVLTSTATATLGGTPLVLTPGGTATYTSGAVPGTHTDFVNPINFALYTGLGVVNLSPITLVGTDATGSVSSDASNFTVTVATLETLNANGTLVYTYLPAGSIPEPGATTFLAAGVLGSLGMVIRRRRKA